MSDYITYREQVGEEMGYFILQKEFPHFCGQISERPIVNFIQPCPIAGYGLYVIFHGTLRGNVIPSYKNVGEEIALVMQDMALFFLDNRILQNPKKYKKWLIRSA